MKACFLHATPPYEETAWQVVLAASMIMRNQATWDGVIQKPNDREI